MALKAVSMAELRLEVLLSGGTERRVGERGVSPLWDLASRPITGIGAGSWAVRSSGTGPRRPQRSPGQIDAELEEMICRMHRAHPRWGARRIRDRVVVAGLGCLLVRRALAHANGALVQQRSPRNIQVWPPEAADAPSAQAGRRSDLHFCGADDGIRTRDPNLGKVRTLRSVGITIAHDRAVSTLGDLHDRGATIVSDAFGWQVGWQILGHPDSERHGIGNVRRPTRRPVGPSRGWPVVLVFPHRVDIIRTGAVAVGPIGTTWVPFGA